jgi:hypothetical protein
MICFYLFGFGFSGLKLNPFLFINARNIIRIFGGRRGKEGEGQTAELPVLTVNAPGYQQSSPGVNENLVKNFREPGIT